MKKGQRCILTGKLVEGKDVIIASEIEQYIEKQGTRFIKKKNEKVVNTSNYVVLDDSTSISPV